MGANGALGRNINIAWPRKGLGDAEYLAAFDLVGLGVSLPLLSHLACWAAASSRDGSHV